jgi:hypothetical protein
MSNIGPFVKKANPDTLPEKTDGSLVAPESANAETAAPKARRGRYPEVQSAKRFPIKLPISVKSLPADVVGAEADVRLDCRGRVVRSFEDSGRRGVGVVIDEYRFDRAEQRGD